MGVISALHRANPNALTVLNYHRIADSTQSSFDSYKPNVSATPNGFVEQLTYVKKHYNVISVKELTHWLEGRASLPQHSALITFDDGYQDNFENAFPVLRDLGLPAIIFLATDFMSRKAVLFWDIAAYCAYYSKRDYVRMPSGEVLYWEDVNTRDRVLMKWVHAVKHFQLDQKKAAIEALVKDMDVAIPEGAFNNLYMKWEQVRHMLENGIEFGAHTISHPILTKISLDQAEHEISGSKKMVEDEIGRQVDGFAYPNGGAADFSPQIVDFVRKSGYKVAFTLMPGPTSRTVARKNPFEIRRVYIGRSDTLPRFAAKLAGAEKISRLFGT